MVSEDSQDLGWLPLAHRLSDRRNLDDATRRQVLVSIHELDDPCEPLEALPLRGPQRTDPEERDDDVPQVREPADVVPGEVLPMVVVPPIHVHMATSEEVAQLFQDTSTAGRLDDHKGRLRLPAERGPSVSKDRATEAALSVNETDDPSLVLESFLLVFRISHIVTAAHVETSTAVLYQPRKSNE